MEGFYGNIGGKLKGAAFLIAVLGIIASVICAIMIWCGFGRFMGGYGSNGVSIFFTGLIVGAAGSLLSYIGSWILYAFGTMVENLQILADATMRGSAYSLEASAGSSASHYPASPSVISAPRSSNYWKCPKCGCTNYKTDVSCENCHTPRVS